MRKFILVATAAIVAAFAGSSSTVSAAGLTAMDDLSSQMVVRKKVIVRDGDRGRGARGRGRGRGAKTIIKRPGKTVIIKKRGGVTTKKVIVR